MATAHYNGVDWLTLFRTNVSSRPVLDDAGRTTVGVEHTWRCRGVIANTGGTDDQMEEYRRRLMAVGGELIVEDSGFGTLHVNGSSVVRDARNGPTPSILEWKPLGGDGNAAELDYSITTIIPECDDATYQFGLMAFNMETSAVFSATGRLTAYRCSGYLEIPVTRRAQSDRTPPDCVDKLNAYRERLESRIAPLGFKRNMQDFRVKPDQRRLDFAWVDEQQAGIAPPSEVADIKMSQDVQNQRYYGRQWTVRWNAEIKMALGVPKMKAVAVFLGIVYSRIKNLGKTMILDMTVRENLYDESTTISMGVKHTQGADLDDIMSRHGMFQEVAGSTWGRWRSSMYQTKAWTSRGVSGLSEDAYAIVDLCQGGERRIAATGPTNPRPSSGTVNVTPPAGRTPPRRSPDDTWVWYEVLLKWVEVSETSRHKALPVQPVQPAPGPAGNPPPFGGTGLSPNLRLRPAGTMRPFPESRQGAAAPNANGSASAGDARGAAHANEARSSSLPPDIMQKSASATRTAVLYGTALRLGQTVPPPKLVSVGGSACVELRREITPFIEGQTLAGETIHGLEWAIWYAVPEAPTGNLETPSNPWIDVSGR